MNEDYIKQLLTKYHLEPKHILGQNFLLDETVMIHALDSAKVTTGDKVIEVGPGIGTLTELLLAGGANVLAIEKDESFRPLLNALKKKYPQGLEVVYGDALRLDLAQLAGGEFKIVANIPYYLTGKLVNLLLHGSRKPTSVTILVQKEVAENMTAKPGKMGLLALSIQMHAIPQIVEVVPKEKFYPRPKVDSALVHLEFPRKLPFGKVDEEEFFRVARACFAGKRKTLRNTLRNNLGLTLEQAENALNKAELSPEFRPQHLSIPQWQALVKAVRLTK